MSEGVNSFLFYCDRPVFPKWNVPTKLITTSDIIRLTLLTPILNSFTSSLRVWTTSAVQVSFYYRNSNVTMNALIWAYCLCCSWNYNLSYTIIQKSHASSDHSNSININNWFKPICLYSWIQFVFLLFLCFLAMSEKISVWIIFIIVVVLFCYVYVN